MNSFERHTVSSEAVMDKKALRLRNFENRMILRCLGHTESILTLQSYLSTVTNAEEETNVKKQIKKHGKLLTTLATRFTQYFGEAGRQRLTAIQTCYIQDYRTKTSR